MAAYDQPGFVSPIPGIADFDARSGTAPGTQGITASEPDETIMTVEIPKGDTYQSGQVSRTPVVVGVGDTSGMSDDLPAHSSEIVAADEAFLLSTGAGKGHTFTNENHRYPWQSQPGR